MLYSCFFFFSRYQLIFSNLFTDAKNNLFSRKTKKINLFAFVPKAEKIKNKNKNKKQNKKLSESSQTDTIGSCQTQSQFPPIP